jgi:TctA family transporter
MKKYIYNKKLHFLSAFLMLSMIVFYVVFMYQNGFSFMNLIAIFLGLFCLAINVNILKNKSEKKRR